MVFEPMLLKAEVGDSVNFVPKSKGHTSQSVYTPDGAKTWKGKTSQPVTVTLDKEGLYIYECQNHGIMGMVGMIQVGEVKSIEKAKTFFEKYKNKFIMNKTRFDNYFLSDGALLKTK